MDLTPDGIFTFSASAGAEDRQYELKLELFDKVNVEVRRHFQFMNSIDVFKNVHSSFPYVLLPDICRHCLSLVICLIFSLSNVFCYSSLAL